MKSDIEPMKEVTRTLKHFKSKIRPMVKYKITNSFAEYFNGKIQNLKTIAKGYRSFNSLGVAILFYRGQLEMFSKV